MRVHPDDVRVMAHSTFDPRALMDNRAVGFDESMEGIDTIPTPRAETTGAFTSARAGAPQS